MDWSETMILYLPERLYNELNNPNNKYFTSYFNLSHKIENYYSSLKSFEQVVLASPKNNKTIQSYKDELDKIINEAFSDKPEYIEEYRINNGDYNREEMLDKIVREEDTENRFFLLSNIINQTYSEQQSIKYLKAYVAFFEILTDEEKEKLSKYVWLKYMYSKIYTTAYSKPLQSNSLEIFINLYKNIKNAVKDNDITSNYFFEAINDATRIYLSKTEGRQDYINILDFSLTVEEKIATEYQYYNYSSAYINMLDIRNTIYLSLRKFTSAYHITSRICKYINEAFKDEQKLLRGLAYYDKCNHNNFALITRKYLKIIEEVPLFSKIKLDGIPEIDKEYFLSDRIGKEVASSGPNQIIDTTSVKNIDGWFSNNENLDDMKNIIIGE